MNAKLVFLNDESTFLGWIVNKEKVLNVQNLNLLHHVFICV